MHHTLSPAAGKEVERGIHKMKQGKLKSGRRGKKVTDLRQAIAIGLSKAHKKGKGAQEEVIPGQDP